MPKPYRVLIIDGSYLCRSNWEATKNETSKRMKDRWMPNIIRKIFRLRERTLAPTIIICWDTATSSNRRKEICPTYKSGRPATDPRYKPEMKAFKSVLPYFGLLQAESAVGEADDIIATLAWSWPNSCVYTIDKDMLQLADCCDVIWAKHGGKPEPLINTYNCKEVSSLTPTEWTAFLSLAGDSADKISGVPKVGEKRAKEMIAAVDDILWRFELAAGGDREQQEFLLKKMKDDKYLQLCCNYRKELKLSEQLVRLRKVPYKLTPADTCEDMAMIACTSWEEKELFNRWFYKETFDEV